jgi:hypothetical protein
MMKSMEKAAPGMMRGAPRQAAPAPDQGAPDQAAPAAKAAPARAKP